MPRPGDGRADEPLLAPAHRRRQPADDRSARNRQQGVARVDRTGQMRGQLALDEDDRDPLPLGAPRRVRRAARRPWRGPEARATPSTTCRPGRPERRPPRSRHRPGRSATRRAGGASARAERPDLVARTPDATPHALLLARVVERRLRRDPAQRVLESGTPSSARAATRTTIGPTTWKGDPWGATRSTTSSSSRSASGRRRSGIASTRCRTAWASAREKPLHQAHFRAMKAEGGWAAVCTEYCAISPDSDETPFISARLWDDDDVRALARHLRAGPRARRARRLRAPPLGRPLARGGSTGSPRIAPSQLASDYLLVVPKAMEKADIRRVQADWVAAARRARTAGFDIVYVYGAHSYLPMQFLSPFYNKRTDEYGGSLENRARFWLETLELVTRGGRGRLRVASPDRRRRSRPVRRRARRGARVRAGSPTISSTSGTSTSAPRSSGRRTRARRASSRRAGSSSGPGARARRPRSRSSGVGRLTSPDRMAEIVASGVWDIIGAARPSIADPFLPRKIEEGRYDEIRECIGCNVCIPKSDPGGNVGCTQNATAGEEYRRGWHPERFERAANADRDVLVVGAGPAGMECAIVLGKRGFAPRPPRRRRGGDRRDHALGARGFPGRGEWARVLNWRQIQLDKLRQRRDPHRPAPRRRRTCASTAPRSWSCATGARWAADGLNRVTHAADPGRRRLAAARARRPSRSWSTASGRPASGSSSTTARATSWRRASPSCCAAEGFAVELVTCLEEIAPFCHETLEQTPAPQRLHTAGIGMRAGVVLDRDRAGRRPGADEFGDPVELEADAVVLVTQRLSNEALYLELRGRPGRARGRGDRGRLPRSATASRRS